MASFKTMVQGMGALMAPLGSGPSLTVLLYHRVLAQPDPLLPHEPDAAMFNAQLASLSSVFRIVPLEDALRQLRQGTLPARSLCITFDDGYRDNIEVAVPILKKHGLTATFFIATGFLNGGRMMHDTVIEATRRLPVQECDLDWVGMGKRPLGDVCSRVAFIDEFVRQVKYLPFQERAAACQRLASDVQGTMPTDLMMTSEQVRQLVTLGMTVGAHTHDHPILSRLTPDEATDQIVKGRNALADILGAPPVLFAYPNGKPNMDYGALHVDIVRRAGFSGAVSVSMGTATQHSDHFQVPRFIPWDRDPRRLVLRVLAHRWRHPEAPTASA